MDSESAATKIRLLYDEHGAEVYYRDHAATYENPHLPQVQDLLKRNFHRLDCSGKVLDFAAGGGEVTQTLRALGAQELAGCDPYTFELFEKKTGLRCSKLSFMDIIVHGLPEQYSTIVSSFALHLCPPKKLFSLAWNLLQSTPLLVVITPHKRPALETVPGIALQWEDVVENQHGKKVRIKAYGLVAHPGQ